ncbi:MAG: hypothetical protein HY836_06380 [Aquabacterium sp.]|uniref:hypothetical protein n=1 Tax=Aquabacterium sp. TaxID=1872578 RepID=UPI0025C335AA|nr:hypothetical protein [Aquabacterium sp.]MBI5925209.1 hypothetical protein [Aquabacterium sp.]
MLTNLLTVLKRVLKGLISGIGRAISTVGIWLIALVLLFEEWGWEYLAAIVAWFGRLPGLRWIEGRIRGLPPYGALALFVVPALTLLPVKLLALYWLGNGHTVLGVSLIVAAKLGGTAITARLFMLTRPTLMRLAWFAIGFNRWMAFKERVLTRVKSSQAWHQWHAFKVSVKHLVQRIRALF